MTDDTPTTSDPTRSTGDRILTTAPTSQTAVSIRTTPDPPTTERRGVIWVTADRNPDDVLDVLRSQASGGLPPRIDVISIEDCLRAATTDDGMSATQIPMEPTTLTVHTIAPGGDVDILGKALVETVTSLDHSGLVPHLMIDNLAHILPHDDEERIFQFLHLITGTARAHGWSVHVTLDPDEVPTDLIELVTPLFDDVN